MTQRILYIDALKGLAILFVVMSHIYNFCFGYTGIIYDFITIVDLPLFFFISGYLLKENQRGGIGIAKKLRTLFVPFLFANLFLLFLRGLKTQIASFDNAYFGTWFLLVLFECFLIISFVKIALLKAKELKYYAYFETSVLVLLTIALYLLRNYLNGTNTLLADILCINLLVSYFPYFLFGYLLKKTKWERFLSQTTAKALAGVCVVTFAVICKYDVCTNFLTFSLIKITAILALMVRFGQYSNEIIQQNKGLALLTHFGTYSLDIYLIHFYFLFKIPQIGEFITTTGANWSKVNICCEVIFAIVIAIIISKISIFISRAIFHNTLLKFFIGK